MLFISRRALMTLEDDDESYNSMGYGVVDTDDGIEELWDEDHLGMAINTHHLAIAGAPEEYKLGDIMKPYQAPETVSKLQVKTKLVKQVDVTVHKDAITSITWDATKLSEPVSIRLSDFGDQCDDFLFYGRYIQGGYPVTFVFDDRLMVVRPMAFRLELSDMSYGRASRYMGGRGWLSLGIRFDLRELTKDSLAEIIYSQLLKYNTLDAVIDSKARKERMKRRFAKPEV